MLKAREPYRLALASLPGTAFSLRFVPPIATLPTFPNRFGVTGRVEVRAFPKNLAPVEVGQKSA
jgi:hypothetical protein